MNRRAFLLSMGVAAGAVALGGVPITAAQLDQPFQPGDIFTIEGRYAINPVTRHVTPHLQCFMVTRVTEDDGLTSVDFYPTVNHPDITQREIRTRSNHGRTIQ
jgi:hypothetical protein